MPRIFSAHRSRLAAAAIAAIAVIGFYSMLPHLAPDAKASPPMPASATPGHFVWKGPAPIADEVDWSRVDAAADAGPLAVASY